ncbi:MAG: redoxin domain-containing protein [Thermomicrobiales bacterium]
MQSRLADFEREGVAVFAISYDAVDVLRDFAARHDIEYPLLSDEGSVVIREIGLYNEHLEQQAAAYGGQAREHHFGVPYPGSFVLDNDGVIVEKRFEQSYRVRPQAADLLESAFGAEVGDAAVSDHANNDEIGVTAWLNNATYRPWQQLRIQFGIQIGDGLHIYGRPIPDGFYALNIAVDGSEDLEVQDLSLPEPHPYTVEGLDEQFMAYEGEIRGSLPFFIMQNAGDLALEVTFSYQACTATECFPPSSLTLQLPLQAQDNVPGA